MTPAPEPRNVWTFEDLGFLLGSILPCMFLGSMLERLGRLAAPGVFTGEAIQGLVFQSWLYLLLLGVLYLLAVKRHRQPLWRSLAWTTDFRGAWRCVIFSPVLAVGVAAAGAALRAPLVPTPAEQLLAGNASLFVVGVFSTVLGPAFEEVLFRGFLQTLLTPSLGPALGITLTSLPFALLHGAQYEWSWQHMILIFTVGCVFGVVRQRTSSTVASTLLHMGYNLTLFAAYLVQR